ncbi:hypothetical protein CR103_03150 [Massilia psychrophila]|uniref:Uncharacterized protein n=1 Tax=Massilia psychrophila TaxID=1603353 RepID=A0A2G8T556_9BURK|nr:hypothetical protein CR103_03150 [Massilia psychrophila]
MKEKNVNPISLPASGLHLARRRAPIGKDIGELKLTPLIDKQQQTLTSNLTRLLVPGRLGKP